MKEVSTKQGSAGGANSRSGRGATQQFAKPDWLVAVTDNFKFLENFRRPQNLTVENDITRRDLEEVPVCDVETNDVLNARNKIERDQFLRNIDKELVWSCLTLVRLNFQHLDSTAEPSKSSSYQWEMNWKHTRAEVNQVYEAARLLNLDAEETRDAIIASIFSDAVKNRTNFLIHNVHGAQAAACALSQLMRADDPASKRSIIRIVKAIKEHQVAPPQFMAQVIMAQLCRIHGLNPARLTDWEPSWLEQSEGDKYGPAIKSIYEKVASPFEPANLTEDRERINFSKDERALLKELNIEDWYVPHPENENSKISHVVIAGDHCINYNHPEGFAKIAMLRGPNTDPLFHDDTIHTSLASAVASFSDSYKILRPEIQPMAIAGLRRTKTAVERVAAIMRELFSGIVYGGDDPGFKSGARSVEQAVDRARQKHPELFSQDNSKMSALSKSYRRRAMESVAEILQHWFDVDGELPFESGSQKTPGDLRLPYWNAPLTYAPRLPNGYYDVSKFSDLEERQYAFAQKIREIAVELLRAEEWVF
ncbi:MAG TPA: hypothetical protein V6C97_20105 [Oculatellaceae cyanobacterium]